MHYATRLAAAGIALAGAAGLSCAGPDETPVWSLTKAQYDPYGNAALLSPANDSRVNLLLLLAAGQGKAAPAELGDRTWFAWQDLTEAIAPGEEEESFTDPSRCQSMEGGERDFLAALNASKATSAEKAALKAARLELSGACASTPTLPTLPETIRSATGKAFARYSQGAGAFYAGRFDDATAAFTELAKAPDPWLREAGAYMGARTALNAAQASAFDEYGSLIEVGKRDTSTLAKADAAFSAYLRAYPTGRYAASASGLLRRVHWLAGNDAALGADYAAVLASPATSTPAAGLRLAEEIDYKLPTHQAAANSAGPLLLAVSDLQRMRPASEYDEVYKPIAMTELAGQAAAFKGHEDIYGYLLGAYAFHVAKQPGAVLKLIADDARRPSYDALAFSRQMLRGLALDATADRNARGFWLELLGGATEPSQRRAVELALARHDEVAGALDKVFAADSKVTDLVARTILLQRGAGPVLLRKQARTAPSAYERQSALWMLLAKELTRGFYADFLRDLPLATPGGDRGGIPAEADAFVSAEELEQSPVPLDTFTKPQTGEFACPALRETVATLEKQPLQPAARLCLGDFLRANGFDWFPFDAPLEQGLGSSRSQFPGSPVVRQAIYQAIIADRGAGAAERAYALYRAVNCYAPSGSNDCGGSDVGVSQRKAWFQQLKRDYPQSRWAQELKYYW